MIKKMGSIAVLAATPLLGVVAALSSPESIPAERIAEIKQQLRKGECTAVRKAVAELETAHPNDPDLLIFAANCDVRDVRASQQVFDPEAHEQMLIANGMQMFRKSSQPRAFRVEVSIDEKIGESALDAFGKALDLAPGRADIVVGTVALLVDMDRADDAARYLTKHVEILDAAAIENVGRIVRELIGQNQTATAREIAKAMTDAVPSSGAGPAALSLLAEHEGRFLEAITHLETAVERSPSSDPFKRNLIRNRLLARQYPEAIAELVSMSAESLDMKVLLAIVRSGASIESARSIWKEIANDVAARGTPLNAEQRYVSGYFDALMRNENARAPKSRLRGARNLYSKGIEIAGISEANATVASDPRLLEAFLLIAGKHSRAGRYDLALAAIEDATSLSGATAGAIAESSVEEGEIELYRARALVGLGDFEKALSAYEKSAELGWGAPIESALCRLRSGDERSAVSELKEIAAGNGEFSGHAREKLTQLGVPLDG